MKKPITYFPAIAAITIIAGAMAYWVILNNHQKSLQNDEEILKRARTNYNAVINGIDRTAQLFYEQVVNEPEVLQILRKAESAYGKERNTYRQKLYELLLPHYKRIKSMGFRQLHFHLPDGTSFLRFHRPSKYGDNLKPFRYSVVRTNKELEPTSGFEEGRVINGYRFVFPVIDAGNHLGSVEVSTSFLRINEALEELEESHVNLLIKQSVVEGKLFEDEKVNYKKFSLQEKYVWDKETIEDSSAKSDYDFLNKLTAQQPERVRNALNNNFPGLINISLDDQNYALIFYPIPNVQGAHVASMLMAYPNSYAIQLRHELKIRLAILIFLYLLIIFTFTIIIRRDRRILKTTVQLKKSQTDLAEADEVKSKLFEIITHDMRNHFSAVSGFSDLINRKFYGKDPKMDKLLDGLKDSIHLTSSLMNNLFVWSRIQIGKIDYKPEMFEATKWTQNLIEKFNSILDRKHVQLINNTKGPVYFYADIDMMAYIVNNIVHNAIKYSKKGTNIYFKISDTTSESVILIQDQGKGMSAQEIDRIMSKESWSGSKEGTEIGLGLLITRRLIDYHNGTINIDSERGVGTTVTVKIPKK